MRLQEVCFGILEYIIRVAVDSLCASKRHTFAAQQKIPPSRHCLTETKAAIVLLRIPLSTSSLIWN